MTKIISTILSWIIKTPMAKRVVVSQEKSCPVKTEQTAEEMDRLNPKKIYIPKWFLEDLRKEGLPRTIELVEFVVQNPGKTINLKVMPELPNGECAGALNRIMREAEITMYHNGSVYHG